MSEKISLDSSDVEEEFGINYHTFLRYLHTDTSELEERLEQKRSRRPLFQDVRQK